MGQERGLRPLYPALPESWVSRALRIAMPRARWDELDARVAGRRAPGETQARAAGAVLTALMDASPAAVRAGHWLDFERDKALRLVHGAGRAA